MPASPPHRFRALASTDHRQRIAASLVCAFGIGAALSALLSSADAQFLSRVGTRHLGTAYALSSAVSMALLWTLGVMADRRDRASLLFRGSCIALLLVAGLALTSGPLPRLSAVALLVASKQIGASLELLLWVVIADRFSARQARRALPWIVIAHGAGGALGALAVGPTAQSFGAMAPVWLAGALLALVALSTRLLMRGPLLGAQRRDLAAPRTSESSAFAIMRQRPLARSLALLVASAGVFAPMMYYLLGVSAAAEYRSEIELAGFLGNYRAYVQGAALIAQLVIAPRLAQRLGVGVMLLFAPIGALLASASVGLTDGLLVIVLAQAATRVLDAAIQTPAEQLVQNLLPLDVRGRVAGLIGGAAKRSGSVLGGIAASALIIWPTLFVSMLVLAAFVWLAMAFQLWRRFAELAVRELSTVAAARHLEDSEVASQFSDERSLQSLHRLLSSDNERERASALALLSRLATFGKVSEIDELLKAIVSSPVGGQEMETRIWLCLGRGELPGHGAIESAREFLLSERKERIAIGFALLCAENSPASTELLLEQAPTLDGLAARLALLRVQGLPILDQLTGEGHSAQVIHELRFEIARAARDAAGDRSQELGERLLRSLGGSPDPDLQVAGVCSVVASLAGGSENAVSMLVRSRLAELALRWQNSPLAALREAALIASVAGGAPDLRALVVALGDRDEAVRARAEMCLRDVGDEALVPLSVAALHGRRVVRLASVELLADLRPSSETLEQLFAQELAEMVRCSRHRDVLAQLDKGDLVRRRLHERVQEAAEAALMTLEARATRRGEREAMAEVTRRLARAASERSRARALEALDALLPRKIAVTMLAAIEGRLEGTVPFAEAVTEELAGRDPLTRDLLVYALGAEGRGQFRASIAKAASSAASTIDPLQLVERLVARAGDTLGDVPGLMETIVSLSGLSLFADLSTAQLGELAKVVSWQRVKAGDVLIQEGEEGHCMYFVRSGTLEVRVNGNAVATLGAGEPVGELALFAEDTRTATVMATEPSELGVLTREDIENLVEEVPGLALRLCRAMSRRLAEANRKSTDAAQR